VTPKASPKTSPKHSPKPAEEEDGDQHPKPHKKPSPHASPKASPHASPKASPKSSSNDDTDEEEPVAHKTPSGSGTKKHPVTQHKPSTSKGDDTESSAAQAAFLASKGGGNGTGGAGGNGADPATIDAYQTLIHDRFYGLWEQPTAEIPEDQRSKFTTTLKITIQRDGTISDFSLAHPSGNPVMDQSVLDAAAKVIKIAPIPEGMGSAKGYTVNINFEVE
jgi:TonB family protein